MNKQDISFHLRNLGLAKLADSIRFRFMFFKNFAKNHRFKKEYPEVKLPSDYLMYESFQLDKFKYFTGGREDAQWLIEIVQPYLNLHSMNILDWGCGPARIIRHFPELLGPENNYYGVDYNGKTIQWCSQNIPNVIFSKNIVDPPLVFPDQYFSFIYAISVLTHLSKDNQEKWSIELNRILSNHGIVVLTTHGEAFVEKLRNEEVESFSQGQIVARSNVTEGHRMYGTFHPPAYMQDLFKISGFTIIRHVPGRRINESYISQDVWILKKQILS
ncbi:MAG: class I SAM-dependent methyltransferase [Saprospiraceae bacterium]